MPPLPPSAVRATLARLRALKLPAAILLALVAGRAWGLAGTAPAPNPGPVAAAGAAFDDPAPDHAPKRVYDNILKLVENPRPILADHPEFVAPVAELRRFEAPRLVDDPGGSLDVRAWRFSYNARGIVEVPNRLDPAATAVVMVHPWGIDDGQGWRTPEPAGAADFCTPEKNALAARHTREVVDPFIKSLRDRVNLVLFSLRGGPDPVRTALYRGVDRDPTPEQRGQAAERLREVLHAFDYRGQPLPERFPVDPRFPVRDYFRHFPGLDAGPRYNGPGFWDLPTPVTSDIELDPSDYVVLDDEGYPALRDFLRRRGVRHVLLAGYATDMCYQKTCAGYENLSNDFNVFLVGDATLATFPANDSPRHATNAAVSFASLTQFVTQISWIRLLDPPPSEDRP